MSSIVPLEMAAASNGLGLVSWPKTYSYFFSTSLVAEKVVPIPTVSGVRPNYIFVQPGENFTFSFVDDAISTNTIVSPSSTGAACEQLYINQPALIKLKSDSTYFHFLNETATSFVLFSFYS